MYHVRHNVLCKAFVLLTAFFVEKYVTYSVFSVLEDVAGRGVGVGEIRDIEPSHCKEEKETIVRLQCYDWILCAFYALCFRDLYLPSDVCEEKGSLGVVQ